MKSKTLTEKKNIEAVDLYLTQLLAEIPEENVTELPSVEPIVKEPVELPECHEVVSSDIDSALQDEHQSDDTISEHKAENWLDSAFESLIFSVADTQVAAPLMLLGGIRKLETPLTPLFGQPDWYLGVYQDQDQSLKVIDVGCWMGAKVAKGCCRYIIQLGRSQWAIACTDIKDSIRIDPKDLRLRSKREKRPWLMGIVVNECVH